MGRLAPLPALNDVAKAINVLTTSGAILGIRLAVVLVLAIFKRWRHLVVSLGAFALMDIVSIWLRIDLPSLPSDNVSVTPLVVPTLNGEAAWYFPAVAISALAISLYATAWALVPKGPRSRARAVVTAVLLLVCAARIELGRGLPDGGVLRRRAGRHRRLRRVRVAHARRVVPGLVRARGERGPPRARRERGATR